MMENQKRIACIGDSLTEGHGSSNSAIMSYPAQMQRMLGRDYDVRNFGIGARTGLKRGMEGDGSPRGYVLESFYRESLAFLPDCVLLMFGTNDTKDINISLVADEFFPDMEEISRSYLDLPSKPALFLLTPPFVVHTNWTIAESRVVNEIIPRIRELSRKLSVSCIDIHEFTFRHNEFYTEDGVHLNDYGYTNLAAFLCDFVK